MIFQDDSAHDMLWGFWLLPTGIKLRFWKEKLMLNMNRIAFRKIVTNKIVFPTNLLSGMILELKGK